jgi:murein DD-endopeptidase MepM/ murein hydrolase activator NlpD
MLVSSTFCFPLYTLLAETVSTDTSSTTPVTISEAPNPVDELRAKIDAKNKDIADLERNIKQFQDEMQKANKQGKTLQSALTVLELNRKKLAADISITENKIDAATLSIESLTGQISNKEDAINTELDGLRASLMRLHENDSTPFVETLLRQKSITEAWNAENQLAELQGGIKTQVTKLSAAKTDLTNTKTSTEKKKRELISLRAQLADQKKIVEINKSQTNELLTQSKNTEATYKKMVAESETRRLALQKELDDYESQLKLTIDPSSYPTPAKVLHSPLKEFVVTQLFGDTEFAKAHNGAYGGKGHNGIDLKAYVGTPVYAALAGMVVGTGNTDTVCPGASYGKWVFIKHGNGLSTVYAHLSLIKAVAGDQVETGDLIGYSGSTGYVTGPHLHFGLFASQGVRVVSLKSKICSGTYTVPVADYKAYLNPMLYL